MRVLGVALLSGVVLLGACGGKEGQPATDSTATAAPVTPAPSGAAVAAVAPTGTIHEVRMVGDANGYRFEPATINAKPGDGIKFINASGGPHNVAFDAATVPADQKDQLFANMPNSLDGSSPMFVTPDESWVLSLGNIKAGKYPFHCTPHLAMNMKGEINVQ